MTDSLKVGTDLVGKELVTYITAFEAKCSELSNTKLADALTAEEIVAEVDVMVEDFYTATGNYPSNFCLSMLANYILIHTLKDSNVDKMSKTDIPILSESQMLRRLRSQHSLPTLEMDILNSKYNRNMDSLKKVITSDPLDKGNRG